MAIKAKATVAIIAPTLIDLLQNDCVALSVLQAALKADLPPTHQKKPTVQASAQTIMRQYGACEYP
jgi:hypothetical protein